MSNTIDPQMPDAAAAAPQEEFIARQAILGRQGEIIGYELFAREELGGPMDDPFLASARVLIKAFSQFSVEQLLGGKLAFVNFTNSLFDEKSLELFPAQRIIPEFTITEAPSAEFLATLGALRRQGYRLALDRFQDTPWHAELLSFMDFVKVDLYSAELSQVQAQIRTIRRSGDQAIVATRVETQGIARHCYEAGVDFTQGYYFMRPEIIAGKRIGANHLSIFRLLNLLGENGPVAEIEQAFQKDPGLSYQLLRYMNSAGLTRGQEIDSIRRALILLGRQPLQRWLTLLLFAGQGGRGSPLLTMAATRGRLAEQLRQKAPALSADNAQMHQSFLVGMLSLLDAMLGVPMADILGDLHLPPEVDAAILRHEGENGILLRLIEAIEQGDAPGTLALAGSLGLDMADINQCYLHAMAWAAVLD
ncbi:MAG: EAL and HDOD domain-containing protein [Acidithiobacillus sp.]|uniref:EAL and HDOD domain-containing protein n=2 Tax=Acidithiobacillus sp. TaxID=1872118 RepID=UPI003D01F96A